MSDILTLFFNRAPLFVNFKQNQKNHLGIPQPPCIGCGNCYSGCNTGAKNSLNMNYLPDARAHGAKIFTEVGITKKWMGIKCHAGYKVQGEDGDHMAFGDLRYRDRIHKTHTLVQNHT